MIKVVHQTQMTYFLMLGSQSDTPTRHIWDRWLNWSSANSCDVQCNKVLSFHWGKLYVFCLVDICKNFTKKLAKFHWNVAPIDRFGAHHVQWFRFLTVAFGSLVVAIVVCSNSFTGSLVQYCFGLGKSILEIVLWADRGRR